VSADDEVEVVLLQEFAHYVRAEGIRDAAVVLGPPRDVGLGVRPEQVAQQAGVRHVRRAHDALDLLRLRIQEREKVNIGFCVYIYINK